MTTIQQNETSKEWLSTNWKLNLCTYTSQNQKSCYTAFEPSLMRRLYDKWMEQMFDYSTHFIKVKDFMFYNCINLNDELLE